VRTFHLTLLAAALGLIAPCGGAEETADPDEAPETRALPRLHEEITVTATPILERIHVETLAGSVTTVGRRQIEDLNAQDIASAVRRVPGLAISRYNPIGSYGGGDGGAAFVRGQGSGRPGAEIATSIDGIPKFVGVWTHPLLDLLSVDLVHEVDVYQGAQPVLLGNMAFASVDLVSRRRQTEGLGGHASLAYGSFDTRVATLEQEGQKGRLDWLVSASHRQSDGHREGADGRTRAVFARAGARLAEGWDLSLVADLSDGAASDPGAEGTQAPGIRPRFESSDGMGVATLTRNHGQTSGYLKLYYDDGSIDWRQWDAASQQPFFTLTDWSNYGLRLRDRFAVLGRGLVTAGIDVDSYGGTSLESWPGQDRPLGDFRFRNTAGYVAYQHSFGSAVEVTPSAGLRYNDSRYFGGQWGGQAGLEVSGGFGKAHVRYAHAFNLPGVWTAVFYQGYGRGDQWMDLSPERMDQWEIGFGRGLGSRVRLDVSLFRSDVEDALRFVPPPPPPPSFANTGSYRSRGAEVSVSAAPVSGLCLITALTYIDTQPEDVPFAPGTSWMAGAVYSRGRARVSLDAQRVGESWFGNPRFPPSPQPIGAYTLLNGRIAWSLAESGSEIYLAGENLTGAAYQYRPDYPMPRASVMVGLKVGLQRDR